MGADPPVFFSNTSHCSCPVGGGGSTLNGGGSRRDDIWSNSGGAKFVLQKWFVLPPVTSSAPEGPLLDHPNALAHFPLGSAEHLTYPSAMEDYEECLETVGGDCGLMGVERLLADFGRQDAGVVADLVEAPAAAEAGGGRNTSRDGDCDAIKAVASARRTTGPLPAARGIRLGGSQLVRVRTPKLEQPTLWDGATAGVWVRVAEGMPRRMPLPLLSVKLRGMTVAVGVCLQPVDLEQGRLTLCPLAAGVGGPSEETNLLPLGSWLHVSLALAPADGRTLAASVTVHDVRLLTKVLIGARFCARATNVC